MLVFAKRVERIFRSEWNVLRRVISVGQSVIQPVTVVRDLGVLIDGELSMRQHVTRLAQTCFFHLRCVDNSGVMSIWRQSILCRRTTSVE